MKRYRALMVVLLLDLVGASGALLVSTRTWQVVTTPRTRPLRDDVLALTGRIVDSAPTALALVALAGVVAVLATRGIARRIVGVVLSLAGAGLVWRALVSAAAVSGSRARTLVREQHRTVTVDDAVSAHVSVHPIWAVLTVASGLLVMAAGVITVVRGHRWQSMSARYEARPDQGPESDADRADDRTRASASLWSALDRGEDPTATR